MIFQSHDNLQWAQFPEWKEDERIFHAFTTRKSGVSEGNLTSLNLGRSSHDTDANVDENRNRFWAATGVPENRIVLAHQVHGNHVAVVEKPGVIPNCDGLITTASNLYLIIGVADCHTIFLTTKDRNLVGALHAGWRGIAGNILANALETLTQRFDYTSGDVEIGVSPGIGQCCYEVGGEVANRFSPDVLETRDGSYYLNLAAAINQQAKALEIPGEQIHLANRCTSCESEYWYSYRRDDGVTGRMWGVIGISGEERE